MALTAAPSGPLIGGLERGSRSFLMATATDLHLVAHGLCKRLRHALGLSPGMVVEAICSRDGLPQYHNDANLVEGNGKGQYIKASTTWGAGGGLHGEPRTRTVSPLTSTWLATVRAASDEKYVVLASRVL